MSDELYLTRITLQQFRNFEKLELDLAPEPSVLIVHGSNGLGKSSLFDAMEWALTGSIDHFKNARGSKKPGSYLCRWRTGAPGPTSASLGFSDGSVVERSLNSAKVKAATLGGTVADVTEFLRSDDWKQPISSLDRYLLLTHFLGQTTSSRFTHREDDKRFEMLREASQSGEVEAVAYALYGDGRRPAARAFARQIETLDREAKAIRDLVSQEAELWEAAQSAGAVDGVEGLTEARHIVELLGVDGGTDPSIDAAGLDYLQAKLSERQAAVRRNGARVARAQQLVDDAARQRVSMVQADASIQEAAAEMRRVADGLRPLEKEVADLSSETAAALSALTSARSAHAQLVELSRMVGDLAKARANESDAASSLSSAEADRERANADLQRVERRKGITERLRFKIQEGDERLSIDRTRLGLVREATGKTGVLDERAAALNQIVAAFPDLDRQIEQADIVVAAAEQANETQIRIVSALEASTRSMSAAVSVVANNLSPDACECPVCATRFDKSAVLRERVEAAAERLAPALHEQRQVAETARVALASVIEARGKLISASSNIRGMETQLAADRSDLAMLLLRVGIDFNAGTVPDRLAALSEELTAGIDALSESISRWRYWLELLGQGRGRAMDDARRKYDQSLRARETAARRLSAASAGVSVLAAQVESVGATIFGPGIAIGDQLASATDSAARRLTIEQTRYAAAMAAEQEATTKLTAANSAKASVDALHAQLTHERSELVISFGRVLEEWKALGFNGDEPDQAVLDAEVVVSNAAAADIKEAEDLLLRLRRGREAWRRQETHRDALERLRVALDAAAHFERDQLRLAADQLAQGKENLGAATRRAREIANAASVDILTELQSFNAEYIVPLDRLTKQINQAILCDPNAAIDLRVRDRRIEQTATRSGKVPDDIGDIDPALVHSEGQMAALAVGMLCAASLTYPWSRWQALVLDDPLQHNDAIHAAAFADLVGNLVIEQRYQILITTHDLAQSQFLQRKVEARRSPCAMLQLLGEGRNGVDYTFRPARFSWPAPATAKG